MRDLIILGTGVHAKEMAEIVERVNRANPTWNLLGYITASEKHAQTGTEFNGYAVLGTKECLAGYPDACFVPDNENRVLASDVPRNRLVSLIDPSAFVSRSVSIGSGCVIYPGCYVGFNARIGDFVFCLSGCAINHDDVIEDRAVLASHVSLAGFVHVEQDCYLGQASTIRQMLTVGRGSLVGMGAVVIRDVSPNSVMVGNPARKLRDRR
jgi:sugar O-acyltransferase (sialic acid O-acetyltransferase NeuD family)